MRFAKAVCIHNPKAGGRSGSRGLHAIRGVLRASAGHVELASTNGPGHATELARAAVASGADLVAVLGGDGTLNEAVQGLTEAPSIRLLALPGGTSNVLVREAGMPLHPVKAAEMLPSLEPRAVRLGQVRFGDGASRYFLLMCGAGLDAEIAFRTSDAMKRLLGQGSFWLQGARQAVRRFPQLRVRSEGLRSERACSFVLVSKSRAYGGGLVLTPGANLLSHRFEVAQFPGTSRILHAGYLLAATLDRSAGWPGVQLDRRTEVELVQVGATVRVQVDGEVVGRLPARVSLSPVTLQVMLPRAYGLAMVRKWQPRASEAPAIPLESADAPLRSTRSVDDGTALWHLPGPLPHGIPPETPDALH